MNQQELLAKIAWARAITGGGITAVTKMPCMAYGLPASECGVGSKLRTKDLARKAMGLPMITPCGSCYAHSRGNYSYKNVQAALQRRLESLANEGWVEGMIVQINAVGMPYFRWHHSGDLQSMAHLEKIVAVCIGTPHVTHWLPTQEHLLVKEYLRIHGSFPSNLTVRKSSPLLNHKLPAGTLPTSLVSTQPMVNVHNCPALENGNHCGFCRACWDKNVPVVAYHKH